MTRMLRIVLLLALVSLVIGAVNAQVIRTSIHATELFDGVAGVGSFEPGVVICTGRGEPTGNPFFPCAGSRAILRSAKVNARVTGSGENAALATGWNLIEENANIAENGTARLWGKFTLTLDAGGVWEGVFTGVTTKENGQAKDIIRAVGHGRGGLVDGMLLEATLVNTFPAPFTVAGTIQGVILEIPRAE